MTGRQAAKVTEAAVAATALGVVGALVVIVRVITRDYRRPARRAS